MAKTKTVFVCRNCGMEYPKWYGQCPSCRQWNTLDETLSSPSASMAVPAWSLGRTESVRDARPVNIREVAHSAQQRVSTSDPEFDRILGGGVVPGSLLLLGGEPGIGKSTLMLQIALRARDVRTLYVSGEESAEQIKMRADRIGIDNPECFVLSETNLDVLFSQAAALSPRMVVVDSIQTLYTPGIEASPGSVAQIRECAAGLLRYAKQSGVPVIVIGHITKDGALAGPKILEHMVDAVLQFEGDRNHLYRIVRVQKNRFGPSDEIGIYQMESNGLQVVENPSAALVSGHNASLSGNAVAVTLEGVRPILIEVQALVSSAVYGTPQRTSTGFDTRRLNMLLAVLEKRAGFRLAAKDVFLNITGGLRVDDPAFDLGVAAAVLSSDQDIPLGAKTCFAAEVGLSGEIRPVTRIEQRIGEAQKLGFDIVFVSAYNKVNPSHWPAIRVMPIERIEQLIKLCFA